MAPPINPARTSSRNESSVYNWTMWPFLSWPNECVIRGAASTFALGLAVLISLLWVGSLLLRIARACTGQKKEKNKRIATHKQLLTECPFHPLPIWRMRLYRKHCNRHERGVEFVPTTFLSKTASRSTTVVSDMRQRKTPGNHWKKRFNPRVLRQFPSSVAARCNFLMGLRPHARNV